MYELALFAGAGGGILGGSILGWETIGAVEYNSYAREVLLRRQRDGMLPLFPIWDNVQTFRLDNPETRAYCEAIRDVGANQNLVITAGFPCQPFSAAGKREGPDNNKNMWPDTCRILGELRPDVALLENVPGLLSFDYFGEILGNLASLGFDAEWEVISASDLGAPHDRHRLWILAYKPKEIPNTNGKSARNQRSLSPNGTRWKSSSDSSSLCSNGRIPTYKPDKNNWWNTEPNMGRVAHGVANRVDRDRCLGNGQVPIVAAYAFVRLAKFVGLDLDKYVPNLK